ncbi:hypothetical protein [Phytoactinopolyspora limicola]|uniref:hypothetical protein n=1 Tax=Phytoactinopolyspora limicola TaxID=2715536 RepID=UPI001A9CB123|nr:hypothetical protein [Phytoactinopolyspora limicola]
MTTTVIALLVATTVVGTCLWYVVDRHRDEISVTGAVLAAIVPALLLGATALLGLDELGPSDNQQRLIVAIGVTAAVPGGGLLATAALRLADRRVHPPRPNPSPGPPPPPPPPPSGTGASAPRLQTVSDPDTLRGGAAIGALERVAVTITLLAGWPEGLALILAVKGFGRYPELRKPAAPERFIIGTFASILWGVATAGVVIACRT